MISKSFYKSSRPNVNPHLYLSQLISQDQSYLDNSDILFSFNLQWLDATKSIKDEMNIIEDKIQQAQQNFKLSKDLSGSKRSKIEDLHSKYYQLHQQRDNIILPLRKLRYFRNKSISLLNHALSFLPPSSLILIPSISEVEQLHASVLAHVELLTDALSHQDMHKDAQTDHAKSIKGFSDKH